MLIRAKKKSILSKDEMKNTLLRHIFFTSFRSKGRRQLMLLKTKRYIQVGFSFKKKKKAPKYLLYKSLHFMLNKIVNNKDYFFVNKIRNKRNYYYFDSDKNQSITGTFDLFYYNELLNKNNYVPIFLSQFEYNLYDRNNKLFKIFNYLNAKKTNTTYIQSFNYIIFNNMYLFNLYLNIKKTLHIDFFNVLSKYYLYLNSNNINNIFSIFKILNNTKFKYVKFSINNYIKFKDKLNFKHARLLDKYLIKNRMFRSGKFFYHFLEYMKHFTYSVYSNNLFYRKYKYTKFDGNRHNVKLISFNVDKLRRLKGWFSIYNYIKRYSYLNYNENKNKVVYYFIKKYQFFYNFIIKFFYKTIKNLKFMFIEKFNFKKIQFLKILIFYIFHNKWFKFKPLIWKIRRKRIKKWKIKRIKKFRNLGYMRFVIRIKTKLLEAKFLKRLQLNRSIRKRKKLHFYKYKNSIRIVNWLIKLRRLKNIKNPFKKFKRKPQFKSNNKMINNKLSKLNKINKFKQLSNKDKDGKKKYYNKKPTVPVIKSNVKRV